VNPQDQQLAQWPPNLDAIDLKVRFAVSRYSRQFQEMRRTAYGVTLKENFTPDSIRRPNNGTWSTFDMHDHPGANAS
jgi:hypothetical protein